MKKFFLALGVVGVLFSFADTTVQPCTEGLYYCHAENTCKGGNESCSTVTCNNNTTCETNESCNCPDCTNGGLDDKDYCAKVGSVQLICTKDTAQCRTDRFPYCLPFCLDGYVYDSVTSQCIVNSSTAANGSTIGTQLGACCPPGSAWNSIEQRCVPDTCGEGLFYCASQKKCLPGSDTTCTTKTCDNNGTCENEESCDCADCINGGTDDKDKCSIISGIQAICSDDVPADNLPGACCVPPATWSTIAKSCTGCLSTQAPSELRAGIDQPYITCTGGDDTTKTHFRYRITKKDSTETPFISEIFTNSTQVLHSTMTAGVYTVECFYGTATSVDTSVSATPHTCVKTTTVNQTAQGCRRIYPYVGNTLSDEMIRENPFQASFRCGSRLSVEGDIHNPYMFQVQGSAIAYLQFDALISELFNGLAIGPVSTQTQNYSFNTGTTSVACAVKVGDGYSTNNACRLAACVGADCDNPQTFAIVHSGETMCTSANTSTYNVGCNPAAPNVNLCVQWFREAAQAGSTTVPNGIRFPISFRFGNQTSAPTQVYCIKYAAGQMPGGMNLSDNVVCEATLNNGEQLQIYAADTSGTYSSLQTTARTIELDKENPSLADIKYYTNDSLTTEVSNEYYYNKPVIALAVCTDTPSSEAVACACANTVDTTSNGADLWSQGKPSNLIGADLMSYTRTITDTLSGAKVKVVDTAGNMSPEKIIDFSIDTQKPTVSLTGTGTVTITANDTGSKIWKTTSAPTGATNTNGIIYRTGSDRATIAFDENCNTTSVYAKRTEIGGASTSVTATNISIPSGQILSYCVKDNAGNVAKGFYPIETGSCFSASNMSTIPTLSTYKDLTKSRIELATNTDAQKYGYTFSAGATDATCFRGLLSNNISTLVAGKYAATTSQTTLSNWSTSPAKVLDPNTGVATSVANSEGYYYYSFSSASNNTLSITENPSGAGHKAVIAEGGNIRITKDITYTGGDKYLLLIARKSTAGYGGNIEIDANVKNIDAILIADGGILVSLNPSASGNRLTVNGRIYSYNTRAGSLMASGTNLVDASAPKIYSFSTNTLAAGTISVAKDQDFERFRTIELDGTTTCTFSLNYYNFTTSTLPPLLRKPDSYSGTCSF